MTSSIDFSPEGKSRLDKGDEDNLSYESSVVRRFVPDMLLKSFRAAHNSKQKAKYTEYHGIVGFFDVSGFSKLAHQLEREYSNRKRGSNFSAALSSQFTSTRQLAGLGAEELADKLNDTLGELVDIILSSGGDVIKFAGDAILVFWNCTKDELPEVALKATSSALISKENLPLHIGMGCGNLIACEVGGLLDRWEFFIYGSACSQSAHAEKEASVGELVISEELFKQLKLAEKKGVNIEHRAIEKSTNVLLETVTTTNSSTNPMKLSASMDVLPVRVVNQAKCYIPRPVIDMMGDSIQSVNELRKVTVIFINLQSKNPKAASEMGSDGINPDANFLREAHSNVRAVQAAAYTYYGTLRQVIVDDKGFVAIVVFGLPPLFHEDNAARAIKVATKLFHDKEVHGTAGICTGTVFCGAIGSSNRAEYCVTGDCINLAARLMGKANLNSVLCDTRSKREAEATTSEIAFTKLDKISVKGKDEPIDVYEPKRVTVFDKWNDSSDSSTDNANGDSSKQRYENTSDPLRVVGCAVQKEALSRVQFSSKHPVKAVVVEGTRGQGKTRMAEWIEQASDADHVFTATAESSEKGTPFFVWRPILLSILMIEASDELHDLLPVRTKRAESGESSASDSYAYPHVEVEGNPTRKISLPAPESPLKHCVLRRESDTSVRASNSMFRTNSFQVDMRRKRSVLSIKQLEKLEASKNHRSRLDRSPTTFGGSTGERFFQLSSESGVVHIAKKSRILQRLRAKGKISSQSISYLNEIIPVLSFNDADTFEEDAMSVSSSGARSHNSLDLDGPLRRRQMSILKPSRMFTPQGGGRRARAFSGSSNISDASTGSNYSSPIAKTKLNLIRTSMGLGRTRSIYKRKAHRAIDLMLMILDAVGSLGSTLIIIDDAHNMDSSSKELLLRAIEGSVTANAVADSVSVTHQGPKVRFVLTFLPSLLTKEDPLKQILNLCETQVTEFPCVHTVLQPFTPRESALYLSSELEVSVGEDLLSFLHVRAKGNPHGLSELFSTLEQQAIISVNPDTGVVSVLTALSELVGDTLLALPAHRIAEVYRRFDLLEHNLQALLKLASVIGKVVPMRLLQWLYKNQHCVDLKQSSAESVESETAEVEDEFETAIDKLKSMGFLSGKKGGKHQVDLVVFNRDDERSVIYSMMLRQDRRAIHKEILLWFEEVDSLDDSGYYQETGLLGYHALISEQYIKSFAYFEQSIEEAVKGGDVETAMSFVQQSNEILDLDEAKTQICEAQGEKSFVLRRTKLYFMWGQCYTMKREWEEALKVLELAVEVSGIDELSRKKSMLRKLVSFMSTPFQAIQFSSRRRAKSDLKSEEELIDEIQKYGAFARKLQARISKLQGTVEKLLHKIDQMNVTMANRSS